MNDTTDTPRASVVDQIFGDNKAPLTVVLEADFASLLTEVEDAEGAAAEANKKPTSDAEQAALGKKIADLRTLLNKVDGVRVREKEPVLEASRGIDKFFGDMKNRIADATKPMQDGADAYVRQKAAEERAKRDREAEELRKKAAAEREKANNAKSAVTAGKAEGRAEAMEAQADVVQSQANASAADLTRSRVGGITSSAKGVWKFSIDSYPEAIAPLGAVGPFMKREAIEAALTAMVRIQKEGAAWPGVRFYSEAKATFR